MKIFKQKRIVARLLAMVLVTTTIGDLSVVNAEVTEEVEEAVLPTLEELQNTDYGDYVSTIATPQNLSYVNPNYDRSYDNYEFVSEEGFLHPGIFFSREELNIMRDMVWMGAEPWISAFESLQESAYASLDYEMEGPFEVISSDAQTYPLDRSATAAYEEMLMWYITGDSDYSEKAIEILMSWASTVTKDSKQDHIRMGVAVHKMCIVAEVFRYTPSSGWTDENTEIFNSFINLVNPSIDKAFQYYNQGGYALMGYMAKQIFQDNWDGYTDAVERLAYNENFGWKNGNSVNFSLSAMIPNSGVFVEMGRDQVHAWDDIGVLSMLVKTTFVQGTKVDSEGNIVTVGGENLYEFENQKLLKAATAYTRYNLGEELDDNYNAYKNAWGQKTEWGTISSTLRGREFGWFPTIYYYYKYVAGYDEDEERTILEATETDASEDEYATYGDAYQYLSLGQDMSVSSSLRGAWVDFPDFQDLTSTPLAAITGIRDSNESTADTENHDNCQSYGRHLANDFTASGNGEVDKSACSTNGQNGLILTEADVCEEGYTHWVTSDVNNGEWISYTIDFEEEFGEGVDTLVYTYGINCTNNPYITVYVGDYTESPTQEDYEAAVSSGSVGTIELGPTGGYSIFKTFSGELADASRLTGKKTVYFYFWGSNNTFAFHGRCLWFKFINKSAEEALTADNVDITENATVENDSVSIDGSGSATWENVDFDNGYNALTIQFDGPSSGELEILCDDEIVASVVLNQEEEITISDLDTLVSHHDISVKYNGESIAINSIAFRYEEDSDSTECFDAKDYTVVLRDEAYVTEDDTLFLNGTEKGYVSYKSIPLSNNGRSYLSVRLKSTGENWLYFDDLGTEADTVGQIGRNGNFAYFHLPDTSSLSEDGYITVNFDLSQTGYDAVSGNILMGLGAVGNGSVEVDRFWFDAPASNAYDLDSYDWDTSNYELVCELINDSGIEKKLETFYLYDTEGYEEYIEARNEALVDSDNEENIARLKAAIEEYQWNHQTYTKVKFEYRFAGSGEGNFALYLDTETTAKAGALLEEDSDNLIAQTDELTYGDDKTVRETDWVFFTDATTGESIRVTGNHAITVNISNSSLRLVAIVLSNEDETITKTIDPLSVTSSGDNNYCHFCVNTRTSAWGSGGSFDWEVRGCDSWLKYEIDTDEDLSDYAIDGNKLSKFPYIGTTGEGFVFDVDATIVQSVSEAEECINLDSETLEGYIASIDGVDQLNNSRYSKVRFEYRFHGSGSGAISMYLDTDTAAKTATLSEEDLAKEVANTGELSYEDKEVHTTDWMDFDEEIIGNHTITINLSSSALRLVAIELSNEDGSVTKLIDPLSVTSCGDSTYTHFCVNTRTDAWGDGGSFDWEVRGAATWLKYSLDSNEDLSAYAVDGTKISKFPYIGMTGTGFAFSDVTYDSQRVYEVAEIICANNTTYEEDLYQSFVYAYIEAKVNLVNYDVNGLTLSDAVSYANQLYTAIENLTTLPELFTIEQDTENESILAFDETGCADATGCFKTVNPSVEVVAGDTLSFIVNVADRAKELAELQIVGFGYRGSSGSSEYEASLIYPELSSDQIEIEEIEDNNYRVSWNYDTPGNYRLILQLTAGELVYTKVVEMVLVNDTERADLASSYARIRFASFRNDESKSVNLYMVEDGEEADESNLIATITSENELDATYILSDWVALSYPEDYDSSATYSLVVEIPQRNTAIDFIEFATDSYVSVYQDTYQNYPLSYTGVLRVEAEHFDYNSFADEYAVDFNGVYGWENGTPGDGTGNIGTTSTVKTLTAIYNNFTVAVNADYSGTIAWEDDAEDFYLAKGNTKTLEIVKSSDDIVVSYASTNAKAASVTDAGVIEALARGESTIYAMSAGDITEGIKVYVADLAYLENLVALYQEYIADSQEDYMDESWDNMKMYFDEAEGILSVIDPSNISETEAKEIYECSNSFYQAIYNRKIIADATALNKYITIAEELLDDTEEDSETSSESDSGVNDDEINSSSIEEETTEETMEEATEGITEENTEETTEESDSVENLKNVLRESKVVRDNIKEYTQELVNETATLLREAIYQYDSSALSQNVIEESSVDSDQELIDQELEEISGENQEESSSIVSTENTSTTLDGTVTVNSTASVDNTTSEDSITSVESSVLAASRGITAEDYMEIDEAIEDESIISNQEYEDTGDEDTIGDEDVPLAKSVLDWVVDYVGVKTILLFFAFFAFGTGIGVYKIKFSKKKES